jgi:hypothetical protein
MLKVQSFPLLKITLPLLMDGQTYISKVRHRKKLGVVNMALVIPS